MSRIMSKDAQEWFDKTHKVHISGGGFMIQHLASGATVKRNKYIAVLQYGKNQYASYTRKQVEAKDGAA